MSESHISNTIETNLENKTAVRFSKILSYLLHPLIIPTIAVFLLAYGNSVLSILPGKSKMFLVGIVALLTFVIPTLFILLLQTLKYIPDLSLLRTRERFLPMIIVAASYLSCTQLLSNMFMPFMIQQFLYAALACVVFVFVVTVFWKISLHMTAIGGLVTLLMIFNFAGYADFPYTVLMFILLAGLLGTARLYLGYHNGAQIAAGFFSGFIITTLIIFFF